MTGLLAESRLLRRLPTPERAKQIRVAAGISRQRLGEELGVHRTTIARWEEGIRRPRGSQRARYAQVLEVLAGELDLL